MATALIEQKEAARLLGVSEDDLKEMVGRNEIFGYRDGPNWKFKMQELERVAEERGIQLGAEPADDVGGSGIDSDLEELLPVDPDDATDEGESILVSEEELGQSGIGTASTIIGRESLDPSESDVQVRQPQPASEGASDVLMSTPSDDLFGASDTGSGKGSDVELVAGSDIGRSAGDTARLPPADDVLEMELAEGSKASAIEGGDQTDLEGALPLDGGDDLGDGEERLSLDSGISLSMDEGDDADALTSDSGAHTLSLHDDLDWDDESPTQLGHSPSDTGKLTAGAGDDDLLLAGSGVLGESSLGTDDDSALALGEEDRIELGSGPGSDVTLGSGDSGIGLANPTDSGLSLEEEPIELGGSQVGSMALGEDDMIELEEEGDPEAATQLKADDDFLLTPVDDDADEESDSGSQVIALDTEQFDDTADTMLAAGPAVLEEDDFGAAMPGGAAALGGPMPAGLGQPMMYPAAQLPEAKYSIWNVLSLMLVLSLMVIVSLMMTDLVRNMWEFDQPTAANRPIMEFVLSIMPGK